MNSGASGSGRLKKSFLSKAKLFTFQRANSLWDKYGSGEGVRSRSSCALHCSQLPTWGREDHPNLPIAAAEVKDLLGSPAIDPASTKATSLPKPSMEIMNYKQRRYLILIN